MMLAGPKALVDVFSANEAGQPERAEAGEEGQERSDALAGPLVIEAGRGVVRGCEFPPLCSKRSNESNVRDGVVQASSKAKVGGSLEEAMVVTIELPRKTNSGANRR